MQKENINIKESIEEYENLMENGMESISFEEYEIAEEYFHDAGFVLQKIPDEKIRKELEYKYPINPLDYI